MQQFKPKATNKQQHTHDSFANTFYWFICSFFKDGFNYKEGVPKNSYYSVVNDLYSIRDETYKLRVSFVCNAVQQGLKPKERHFFKTNQGLFSTDYDPTISQWIDTQSHITLKTDLVILIKQAYQECVATFPKKFSQRYHLARNYDHPSAFTINGLNSPVPDNFQRQQTGPYGAADFEIQHADDPYIQQSDSRQETNQQNNSNMTTLVNQARSSKPKLRQVDLLPELVNHTKLVAAINRNKSEQPSKVAAQQEDSDDLDCFQKAYKKKQVDPLDQTWEMDDDNDETNEVTKEKQKKQKKKQKQAETGRVFNKKTGRVDDQRRDASVPEKGRKKINKETQPMQQEVKSAVGEAGQPIQQEVKSDVGEAGQPMQQEVKPPVADAEQPMQEEVKQDVGEAGQPMQEEVKPAVAEAETQTDLDSELQKEIDQLKTVLAQASAALSQAMKEKGDLKQNVQYLEQQLQLQKQEAQNRQIDKMKQESVLEERAWFFVVDKIQKGNGTEEQINQMRTIKSYQDEYTNKYLGNTTFRANEQNLHQAIYYSLFRAYHESKQEVQCVMCHTLVAVDAIPAGCKTINDANQHETSQNMCAKTYLYAHISRQTVLSGMRFAPLCVAYEILKRAYKLQNKDFPINCNKGYILQPRQREKIIDCDFDMLDQAERSVVFNAVSFETDVSTKLQNKLQRHLIDDRGQQYQNAWSHAFSLSYNVLTMIMMYKQHLNQHGIKNQKVKFK